MSYLFSKQDPTEVATRTACSKLSNNAALMVSELAREPAQGLMHVVTHVQRSIPTLLDTHHQLEAAAAQLQAVLEELQDAQEGVLSITSPATQQDLAALAASLQAAAQRMEQQQQARLEQQQQARLEQQQELLQGGPEGANCSAVGSAAAAAGGGGSSSSRMLRLFSPGAGAGVGSAAGS